MDVFVSGLGFDWLNIRFLLQPETHQESSSQILPQDSDKRPNLTVPRVINVDKHPAYIGATRDIKKEKLLPEKCLLRQSQYMNNIIEKDHRFMKWQIRPGLGFGSYATACKTIQGYEVMNMIRKVQMEGIEKGNIKAQNHFIAGLFGLVA